MSWNALDCLQLNGELISYIVEFAEVGKMFRNMRVKHERFILSKLSPDSSYTFRLATANEFGIGPFTDKFNIRTKETSMHL